MNIIFDPDKNKRNIEERGLDFNNAIHLDLNDALVWEDTRNDYAETRYIALGPIDNRVFILCFTIVNNHEMRVISFRKANKREVAKYDQFKANN